MESARSLPTTQSSKTNENVILTLKPQTRGNKFCLGIQNTSFSLKIPQNCLKLVPA